jgi:hypothetical protein
MITLKEGEGAVNGRPYRFPHNYLLSLKKIVPVHAHPEIASPQHYLPYWKLLVTAQSTNDKTKNYIT